MAPRAPLLLAGPENGERVGGADGTVRVLAMMDYYLPGYRAGGPLRTMVNMVEQLAPQVSFRIVTRDRDFADVAPYPGVRANAWNLHATMPVYYAAPGYARLSGLAAVIRAADYDVLYLNSFFSPWFSTLPLLLRRSQRAAVPVVLAPRGEFSPGALELSRSKKRTFLEVVRWLRLHRGVCWQASSEDEADHIRQWFGSAARVFVAPDLRASAPQDRPPRPDKQPGRLKVAFLSRLDRKKNLDGALRMLQPVRGEIEFAIHGPIDEAAYWEECQGLIGRLPPNVRVTYRGPVSPVQVVEVLREHDLFLFPSHGENFGHVIHEALLAGCPVLLSDRTPWRQLEEHRAGWDLPLEDPAAFTAVLERCIGMDADGFRRWSEGAFRLGAERSCDEQVVALNRRLFVEAARSAV